MIETEERFSKLRFAVHKTPIENDLAQAFPNLFIYKEFKKFAHEHKALIIRYICFMYDPGSELIEEFPEDMEQRRNAAATAAGIERIGDKWPKWFTLSINFEKEEVKKVMIDEGSEDSPPKFKDEKKITRDKDLIMMILRFIRIFRNRLFIEICTLEMEYDRMTKQRWEGVGLTDPSKIKQAADLSNVCDSHLAKLNSLYNEFFGDKDLEKEVVEMMTPENLDRLRQST
jgi:hypothetical protein